MTSTDNHKYSYYTKVAWAIYYVLALVIAAMLVFFVAEDNEERFFYGFMTVAAAYAFRPTEASFSKLIFKFTGVSRNREKE